MPLVGYLCEYDNQQVTFEDCIRCAEEHPRCDFTSTILSGMAGNDRAGAGISVTNLVGCLRQSYFALSQPYHQRPSKLWPAYRGTLAHDLMERSQRPGRFCEIRFARELDGVWLTGKPDEIIPIRHTVIDYKTHEGVPNGLPDNYAEQLNGYRLILADGVVVTPNPHYPEIRVGDTIDLDVTKLGIVWLTMSKVRKCLVPVWDIGRAYDLFASRLALVSGAMKGGRLPERGIENPVTSPFCSGWCPHVGMCVES